VLRRFDLDDPSKEIGRGLKESLAFTTFLEMNGRVMYLM
jgi:hypothetical protein